ncbi:UNVERIFIED_CONTAM: hypothetical protein GTU68_019935, partial [Idotea baltica]|nr:hypothetical protein [Idotea baltica]
NHNGDIELAKKLIKVASEAGADAIKFQTFKADLLATKNAEKHAMLKNLELKQADHDVLIRICRDEGITFLSTAFDLESLGFLKSLDVPLFKIPSGEITNLPLLRQIATYDRPVIMSTGMATLEEAKSAVGSLVQAGLDMQQLTLLHCTTEYPTPFANVNLRAMQTLAQEFPHAHVGYSDHTLGIEIPVAAVAMGATVIEKHFTLDRNLPGPDHAASLLPGELKEMVIAIRNTEKALGNGVKEPSSVEIATQKIARKNIVASRPISKGEIFSEENLAVKRAGGGASPMLWDTIVGQAAGKDYLAEEPIHFPLST